MSMKKVLVLGDSHTQALAQAHEARTAQGAVQFDINWLAKRDGERPRGNLEMADALERAALLQPGDIIAISILGTLHNIYGLLRHEQPFDVFDTGDETMALEEGCSVVPEKALWDMFKDTSEQYRKKTAALRSRAGCHVYHLATPPPKEDNEFIASRIKRYRGRSAAEAGVNHPSTRLKLWRLEMRVLAELCAEWTVRFLPAPAEAQTPDGFLKPEGYANDATHANAAYGELVLRQLEAVAEATSTARETA